MTTGRPAVPSRLGLFVLTRDGGSLCCRDVAQQADLKQTGGTPAPHQATDGGTGADQSPSKSGKSSRCVEQDIPSLRGDLDKSMHRSQVLESSGMISFQVGFRRNQVRAPIGDSEALYRGQ